MVYGLTVHYEFVHNHMYSIVWLICFSLPSNKGKGKGKNKKGGVGTLSFNMDDCEVEGDSSEEETGEHAHTLHVQ